MSREALHESLSAVMDNEADELELRRVLAASEDAEVRAAWSRLQIARAAMHKELLEPRLDLAGAVAAAIARDEVPAVAVAAACEPTASVRSRWTGFYRVAVAASVTVAVLAGVRLYNEGDVAGPQMAAQPPVQQVPQSTLAPQTKSPAVLAGYNDRPSEVQGAAVEAGSVPSWHEQHLQDYVRQHSQQAAFSEQAEPSTAAEDAQAR